jgi:uncharacterized protein (TIGR03083 family)
VGRGGAPKLIRVEHQEFVDQFTIQARALRAAAVEAGPSAPVDTCPLWTVHDLVRHIAGVNAWAVDALRAEDVNERPEWPTAPDEWDDLLVWWDERAVELADELRAADPGRPTWTLVGTATAGFWARRQAHEAAIHRLDAEHARLGGEVPPLLFTPEFAADGVDEFLTRMTVIASRRKPVDREGTIVLHAADAGQAWEVRLAPGEVPVTSPVTGSGTDGDTTVAGTADALFRAVWGRPSGAAITGDSGLLDALPRV